MAGKKSHPREKTRLEHGLSTYGLDGPVALGKAIGVTKQHAHQILTGKYHGTRSGKYPARKGRPYRLGVKVAKRIGAATGLPWTLILEWQEQENGR